MDKATVFETVYEGSTPSDGTNIYQHMSQGWRVCLQNRLGGFDSYCWCLKFLSKSYPQFLLLTRFCSRGIMSIDITNNCGRMVGIMIAS